MSRGHHGLEFEVVEGWERLPDGWSFTEMAGVAVDSRDRVYVFCRGENRRNNLSIWVADKI